LLLCSEDGVTVTRNESVVHLSTGKRNTPSQVTELSRLEEKRPVQGVSYFLSRISIFI
jgi:hypothetical protein